MTAVPLSQAKTHLAKLLAEVEELGEEVVITRSGRPVAVLLSLAEYEGLLETLEILGDRDFAKQIELGLKEAASGELLRHEDVWDGLGPGLQR